MCDSLRPIRILGKKIFFLPAKNAVWEWLTRYQPAHICKKQEKEKKKKISFLFFFFSCFLHMCIFISQTLNLLFLRTFVFAIFLFFWFCSKKNRKEKNKTQVKKHLTQVNAFLNVTNIAVLGMNGFITTLPSSLTHEHKRKPLFSILLSKFFSLLFVCFSFFFFKKEKTTKKEL